MIKQLRTYKILLLLGILLVFLMGFFANQRFVANEISDISVEFEGESNHFVSQGMLINLLKKKLNNPVKIYVNAVDLNQLETALNQNEMIENAEVFFVEKNSLKARVTQKKAIARVFDGDRSYYIDRKGNRMPLSTNYSARVPVVYGRLKTGQKEGFLQLMEAIETDDFLRASITSMMIKGNKEVVLYVRDYDFSLELGPLENVEEKLKKYKGFVQFYRKNTSDVVYKSINLNYSNQVICLK